MGRKLPTWLTEAERRRLLKLQASPRDKAIVSLFLFSGLRSNELRMLDIDDLDFDTRTILVRYGKRSKQRLVPLHPEAAVAVSEYLDGRTTGPIFLNRFGERLSNRWLRMLIKSLGQQAGLRKNIHPHALRHSFAVALLEKDADLETIKNLLGHTRIETTSIYLHCSAEKLRSAVDRI